MDRPKGLKCPYSPDHEKNEYYGDIGARDESIWWAGADAMLDALSKLPYVEPATGRVGGIHLIVQQCELDNKIPPASNGKG